MVGFSSASLVLWGYNKGIFSDMIAQLEVYWTMTHDDIAMRRHESNETTSNLYYPAERLQSESL